MFPAIFNEDTADFRNIPVSFRNHLDTVGSSFWKEVSAEQNEAFGNMLAKWADMLSTSDSEVERRIADRITEAVQDAEDEANYGETIYLKVGAFAVGIYARCGHWRLAASEGLVRQDKFALAINKYIASIEI